MRDIIAPCIAAALLVAMSLIAKWISNRKG